MLAPELAKEEMARLKRLPDDGFVCESSHSAIMFLADILLRVIRQFEREDDYQQEQNERR